MGKGQKLYSKAKQIVAGGNMLLSKRPEMFLPEHWPAYFTKTRGCEVWDLDGNKYVDTLMMPGTNSHLAIVIQKSMKLSKKQSEMVICLL